MKRAVLAALVLCGAMAAAFAYARSLPEHTDEEVADAIARIESQLPPPDSDCERAPLFGDAIEAPVELAPVVNAPDEGIGRCAAIARREDVVGAMYPTERALIPWFAPDGAHPGQSVLGVGVDFGPNALFDEVLAECEGLGAFLEQGARSTQTCSFSHPDGPVSAAVSQFESDALLQLIGLARATVLLANERATGGDAYRAMQDLLRGLAVLRDVRMGAGTLLATMVSLGGEDLLTDALHGLLIYDFGIRARQFEELLDGLAVLRNAEPNPRDAFLTEPSVFTSLRPTTPEERGVIVAASGMLEVFEEACPDGRSAPECVEALPFLPPYDESMWDEVFGPRFGRHPRTLGRVGQWTSALPGYFDRQLLAEARLDAIGWLLTLARDRAWGRCPEGSERVSTVTVESSFGGTVEAFFACPGHSPPSGERGAPDDSEEEE